MTMAGSVPLFAVRLSRVARACLLATIASLSCGAADAHTTGTSYLRIDARAGSGTFAASWDIALTDLQWALDLDTDGDAKTSSDELLAQRERIISLATKNLNVQRGGAPCAISVDRVARVSRDSQPFAALRLRGRCLQAGPLQVSTGLFFGSTVYTALLNVQTSRGSTQTLLSRSHSAWTEPAVASWASTLLLFLAQGIWHVLIGYDHIAFLLLLLLPSVLRVNQEGWQRASSVRYVFRDVLKIVTAFTIAHSITLGLAASGALRLPTPPIEAAIAGSIVIAGLINLFPRAASARLAVAFGFGLVHGFGFANALGEIGAKGFALAPMLAGFNLGVEVAQLLIVALTLPVLMILSARPLYARRVMPACSLLIALAGTVWLTERLATALH